MKKEYKKPAIYVEEFKLDQYIAASCGNTSGFTHGDPYTCSYDVGIGSPIFADKSACALVYPVTDGTEINGYCYHNPNDSMKIFAS